MAQVVIDANIGIALVVNMADSVPASEMMKAWGDLAVSVVVPRLWWYEVVSVLRIMVVGNVLTVNDADDALADLAGLQLQVAETPIDLHRAALRWAHRLKQTVAYDAQYLALSEKLGAEFWTSDRRLVNSAQQHGIEWVKWLGDRRK